MQIILLPSGLYCRPILLALLHVSQTLRSQVGTMLRITAQYICGGAKRYFGESLTRDDSLLSQGQEVAGLWAAKGPRRLGLLGPVDQESYFALCDNRHPASGERLTPRQKENRRVGYDWTFSASKAISVLTKCPAKSHFRSLPKQLPGNTSGRRSREWKTRVRSGGKNRTGAGNMAWAEFNHFTARPSRTALAHLPRALFRFNTTYDEVEKR